jgi:succinylglutamate desuccinylase
MDLLDKIDTLPDQFFDITATDIKKVFNKPTLIFLKGAKEPALFVSILLHGNEYSGLEIMQELLKHYKKNIVLNLPRSLWLFIGNVDAASKGQRVLEDEIDFNRAWAVTENQDSKTVQVVKEVMQTITQKELFAAVDLHNNTGKNPHYGCISDIREENKYLCTLFNHIAMVFKSPKGVSTMAFDSVCPAITLECATPGNIPAKEKALMLIKDLMHLDHFPKKPVVKQDLQLVQNSATVKIAPGVNFKFGDINIDITDDLVIINNFDHYNFSVLNVNEVFAYTTVSQPFVITSDDGKDITDKIIKNNNGEISLVHPLMPAMISVDTEIVRQDCLCYLLEDYKI